MENAIPFDKLKNGTSEPSVVVVVTMLSLRSIWNDLAKGGPMAIYELVQICKNNKHQSFGTTGEVLCTAGLVVKASDGTFKVLNSIKNIVLSAAEGEGFDIELVDPVDRS